MIMGIVGRWIRTVAALALVTCAAVASGLVARAGPAAAADGPSLEVLAPDMGQVSLCAPDEHSVEALIQLSGASAAIYSAAIHVGSHDKYEPTPVVVLNDVVQGVSDTTAKMSPDTFRPYGYVLVLTGVDGVVAGMADIGGWAWQGDGRGRWEFQ